MFSPLDQYNILYQSFLITAITGVTWQVATPLSALGPLCHPEYKILDTSLSTHEQLTLPAQLSGYVYDFTYYSTQEDICVTIHIY